MLSFAVRIHKHFFKKKKENFGRRGEPYPAMLILDKHKKVDKMPYKERKYCLKMSRIEVVITLYVMREH